ncbi:MAG: hypothetical protein AB7E58_00030 [Flavobacteriaceae bacterium]
MTGVARIFFATALLWGIAGLILGNVMAASHDHGQMVTHAHTMVIGWISFAIFGLFYSHFPAIARSMLAKIHLVVAEASLLVLVAGLFTLYGGNPAGEPFAAIGAMVYAASFVVFAVAALPVLKKA